jgi:hypothetical protein
MIHPDDARRSAYERRKKKREKHKHGITAQALRDAGFIPTPRIWVKPEDLALIRYMVSAYQPEVEAIRKAAQESAGRTQD